MKTIMEGVIPPVITPYHEDLSIDFDSYGILLEHLVASGAHAVIVGGTTGEYYLQTTEERVKLIQKAKDVLNGRVPLIAGVGGIRTEDCIQMGLTAKSIGCDGILISSPFYAVPTQTEVAEHAIAIDEAVDLPIMLYNYPGRTGTCMESEFFNRIVDRPNFQAIKESSGDIGAVHQLILDYPQLRLFCGTDDQALEYFAWGASGWVCGAGTALPNEHLALYHTCIADNDFVTGRTIMKSLLPYLDFLENGGKFTQSVKYSCELAGLPTGSVRAPLQPLSDIEKEQLAGIVQRLKSEISELTSHKFQVAKQA